MAGTRALASSKANGVSARKVANVTAPSLLNRAYPRLQCWFVVVQEGKAEVQRLQKEQRRKKEDTPPRETSTHKDAVGTSCP